MNLRMIYETYKTTIDKTPHKPSKKRKKEMESVITNNQMNIVQSHYPENYASKPAAVSTVDEDEDIVEKHEVLQPVEMKSIEANLNEVKLDTNRIVHPNAGLSGLYEFVPATQLKGK